MAIVSDIGGGQYRECVYGEVHGVLFRSIQHSPAYPGLPLSAVELSNPPRRMFCQESRVLTNCHREENEFLEVVRTQRRPNLDIMCARCLVKSCDLVGFGARPMTSASPISKPEFTPP
jgi:hypothetical protein